MVTKVLFINSLYPPYVGGGAEIICQEQVENFQNKGYQVSVLTTTIKGQGLTNDEVNGIKVYRAGIKNIYWHFTKNKPGKYIRMLWHLKDIYNSKMGRYISNVIEFEKPDIVICHNITGFSISIWDEIKRHKLPIVQVLHDQYLLCPNSNAFKGGKACKKQCFSCRMMRFSHKYKSKLVDVVIGVSSYVLSRFIEKGYFEGAKQYVIHNARNIPDPGQKPFWNGVSPLKIGYIGTLSKVKGVEWLIQSFMDLDINASLTIAGRGESEDYELYLKELAKSDHRINFSGYVNSVEHYAKIHLSVIPSLWPDTFPTVAFESCANHVPVIATDMGGLPEIIQNGVNGVICDVNKPDSLVQIMKYMMENPDYLVYLTNNSRDSVSRMINEQETLDLYIEKIKDILH